MEPIHRDLPRQPRRALAERPQGRRVRSRHDANGFVACQEQVPLDCRLRRPPEGTHRLAGSRRRGLFPQHQSEIPMKRRQFVKSVSATGLGLAAARSPLLALGGSPTEKVVVAVMGLNGRGSVLAKTFAKTANAEVAAVCDVDSTVLAKAAAAVSEAQGRTVKSIVDFRRALDDKSID